MRVTKAKVISDRTARASRGVRSWPYRGPRVLRAVRRREAQGEVRRRQAATLGLRRPITPLRKRAPPPRRLRPPKLCCGREGLPHESIHVRRLVWRKQCRQSRYGFREPRVSPELPSLLISPCHKSFARARRQLRSDEPGDGYCSRRKGGHLRRPRGRCLS